MKRILYFLLLLPIFAQAQRTMPTGGQGVYNDINQFNGAVYPVRAFFAPKGFQPWATRDSSGMVWFDTTTHYLNYHNGTTRVQIGAGGGGGGVTSITAGYGLNGGTVTSTGTFSVDSTKQATLGRLYKVADSVAGEIPDVTGYVPYTGATDNVDLGSYNLTTDTITGTGAAGLHLHGDATKSGIEITGFGNVRMDAYPITNTGDSVLSTNNLGFIQRYDLKTKLSNYALQTSLNDTASAIRGAIPSVSGYVPYTGATSNVNLGNFGITAKRANVDTLEPNSSAGLHLHNTSHQDILIAGAGGGQNLTVYAPTTFTLMANQSETDTVLGTNSTGLLKKIGIATTYLKKADTVSLSNRINAKQNFSDTSTYDATRAWVNTAISGKVNYSDTSTVIGTKANLNLKLNASDTSSNVVTNTSLRTLTNKRITYRTGGAASYTTSVTIPSDSVDMFVITAQAEALLFNAPSGTPTQGQMLLIRIKDNGTARALTWNAIFRSGDVTLPSTTVISKTLYMEFLYNTTDSRWDIVGKSDNY